MPNPTCKKCGESMSGLPAGPWMCSRCWDNKTVSAEFVFGEPNWRGFAKQWMELAARQAIELDNYRAALSEYHSEAVAGIGETRLEYTWMARCLARNKINVSDFAAPNDTDAQEKNQG